MPNQHKDGYRAAEKAQLRSQVDELKGRPCMDCGGSFPPCAMDFDHRPGEHKSHEINRMVIDRQGWDAVLREIGKCDLVCSNCHRIRTHVARRVLT